MTVPIDGVTICLFTPIFLATLLIVGEFVRRILNLISREDVSRNHSIIANLNMDLALATAILPLFVMILTLIGGLLNRYSVIVFTLTASLFCIYTSRKKLSSLTINAEEIKHQMRKLLSLWNTQPLTISLGIVLFAVLLIRLYPAMGLYVYPADDAKMHTFLVSLIVDNNGYPWSFGKYVSNAGQSQLGVNYPLGFHAIGAFFHLLTLVPVEACVLLITQIYSGLLALSMFFFTNKLFKSELAGLFSAVFFGLVSQQPLFFFGWGGNAELVGNYLLLTFLGLYIGVMTEDRYSVDLLKCVLLFTGMLYIHEFSVFYGLCFILPYVAYSSLSRRSSKPVLHTILIMLTAFVLDFLLVARAITLGSNSANVEVLSDPLYAMLREWRYLGPEYLLYNDWPNRVWHILENWFGLQLVIFSFIGTVFVLVEGYKNKNRLVALIGWLVFLLAVHENGPYGFFFIRIPLWYILFPNRFFLAMSTPLSCLAGYCLSKIHAITQGIASSLRGLARKKRIFYQLLWIVPIGIILINQTCINFSTMLEYRDRAAVTDQDYRTFMWIKGNTPENATFFVTDADSGQWIPAIARRRVLPPIVNPYTEGFVTEEFLSDIKTLANIMTIDPTDVLAVNLLRKYDVNYVFIGAKSIFGRPRLNATLFLNSTHYNLLYHEEGTQVYIFEIVYS